MADQENFKSDSIDPEKSEISDSDSSDTRQEIRRSPQQSAEDSPMRVLDDRGVVEGIVEATSDIDALINAVRNLPGMIPGNPRHSKKDKEGRKEDAEEDRMVHTPTELAGFLEEIKQYKIEHPDEVESDHEGLAQSLSVLPTGRIQDEVRRFLRARRHRFWASPEVKSSVSAPEAITDIDSTDDEQIGFEEDESAGPRLTKKEERKQLRRLEREAKGNARLGGQGGGDDSFRKKKKGNRFIDVQTDDSEMTISQPGNARAAEAMPSPVTHDAEVVQKEAVRPPQSAEELNRLLNSLRGGDRLVTATGGRAKVLGRFLDTNAQGKGYYRILNTQFGDVEHVSFEEFERLKSTIARVERDAEPKRNIFKRPDQESSAPAPIDHGGEPTHSVESAEVATEAEPRSVENAVDESVAQSSEHHQGTEETVEPEPWPQKGRDFNIMKNFDLEPIEGYAFKQAVKGRNGDEGWQMWGMNKRANTVAIFKPASVPGERTFFVDVPLDEFLAANQHEDASQPAPDSFAQEAEASLRSMPASSFYKKIETGEPIVSREGTSENQEIIHQIDALAEGDRVITKDGRIFRVPRIKRDEKGHELIGLQLEGDILVRYTTRESIRGSSDKLQKIEHRQAEPRVMPEPNAAAVDIQAAPTPAHEQTPQPEAKVSRSQLRERLKRDIERLQAGDILITPNGERAQVLSSPGSNDKKIKLFTVRLERNGKSYELSLSALLDFLPAGVVIEKRAIQPDSTEPTSAASAPRADNHKLDNAEPDEKQTPPVDTADEPTPHAAAPDSTIDTSQEVVTNAIEHEDSETSIRRFLNYLNKARQKHSEVVLYRYILAPEGTKQDIPSYVPHRPDLLNRFDFGRSTSYRSEATAAHDLIEFLSNEYEQKLKKSSAV